MVELFLEAYNAALSFYEPGKARSKHWVKFNTGKEFTLKTLSNFRDGSKSIKLTEGLDDAEEFYFSLFARVEQEVGYEFLYSNLELSNIGSPLHSYKHRDRYVDNNRLIHVHWLYEVQEAFQCIPSLKKYNDSPLICEIGGGYGSFASLLHEAFQSKLMLIDLPEANLISSCYLSEKYPSKRIYTFLNYLGSGSTVSLQDIRDYDFFVLPPGCHFSREIEFSAFVNTRSMMEMNFSAISDYFDLIQARLSVGGLFLDINRYCKTTVGESIEIGGFPYDNKWETIISRPAFNQPHIHMLLTKRLAETSVNFSEDIRRIKDLAVPYVLAENPSLFVRLKRNSRAKVGALIRKVARILS